MLRHLDDPVPFVPGAEFRDGVDVRRRRLQRRSRVLRSLSVVIVLIICAAAYAQVRNGAGDGAAVRTDPAAGEREPATTSVPRSTEPSTPSLVEEAQGVWVDASGVAVGDGTPQAGLTINVSPGPGHCGWQDAVVMLLAVPVGSVVTTFDGVHQYIRDPAMVIENPDIALRGTLDTQAQLPPTAEFTGLSAGDVELWVDPDQLDRFVWLKLGEAVERWPRADPPARCI